MEEFRGTKGPWKTTPHEDGSMISIHEGETDAQVHIREDMYTDPTICGIWYSDPDLAQSNANLIAAAPDLLNACKCFLELWRDADMRPEDECHELAATIRSAYNKALGK